MNSISSGQQSPLEEIPLRSIQVNEIRAWLHYDLNGFLDFEDELPNFRMKDNLFE